MFAGGCCDGDDGMNVTCIALRAGPLHLIYDNGMLRSVHCGKVEVVRRVYMALRDRFWNTIPYTIDDFVLQNDADSFALSFTALHHANDIRFGWQGIFTGTTEGVVTLSMRGEAGATFPRNRIGWCVLHPLGSCKGVPCSVEHSDGSIQRAFFPGAAVAPERLFSDVAAMTYPVVPGVECTLRFTGDIFETEDQRNWTDASFKTYSTPQAQPLPVEVPSGTVISQQVAVSVTGAVRGRPVKGRSCRVAVDLEDLFRRTGPVPEIGLGCRPGLLKDLKAFDRLRAIGPAHLRTDAADGIDAAQLREVVSAARKLGCGVELAVHCSGAYAQELDRLAVAAGSAERVPLRLLLYHVQAVVTPEEVVAAAVQRFGALRPHVGLYAGTNRYFVEVNRVHVSHAEIDGVCFCATPQVHTFDDRAVMENVEGLEACLGAAGMVYKDKEIVLSPLTMRPRKDPARPLKDGGADARQQELFGAAWLVASIGACVTAHLSRLTLFSAVTGPQGVMSEDGGVLFPVYQVLRSGITRAKKAAAVRVTCAESVVAAVAFTTGKSRRVLVANGASFPETVELPDIPPGTTVALLDTATVVSARKDPGFWEHGQRVPAVSDVLAGKLQLPPYGVALLVLP
jgi:hypothetical protein